MSSISGVAGPSQGCGCPESGDSVSGLLTPDRRSPRSSCSRKKVDLALAANTALFVGRLQSSRAQMMPLVHPGLGLPTQPPGSEDSDIQAGCFGWCPGHS